MSILFYSLILIQMPCLLSQINAQIKNQPSRIFFAHYAKFHHHIEAFEIFEAAAANNSFMLKSKHIWKGIP